MYGRWSKIPVQSFHVELPIHIVYEQKLHSVARVSVAQWVKRWPTDLAVPGSNPVRCPKSSHHRKRSSTAHSLSLSSAHRPDY